MTSPQSEQRNLTYGQALEHLNQGNAVSRSVWQGFWTSERATFPESNAPNMFLTLAYTRDGSVQVAQPYWVDMMATDWRVVSPEEMATIRQRMAVWANGVHKGHYKAFIEGGSVVVNEIEASRNLATSAYPGKWAKAKTYAKGLFPDTSSANHWDAARLHFLELGGEWMGAIAAGGTPVNSMAAGGLRTLPG